MKKMGNCGEETQKINLIALSLIRNIGPVSIRNLLAYFGEPERVFKARKGQLVKVPGIGWKTAEIILASHTLEKAEKEFFNCQKAGIEIVTILDKTYPKALKEIFQAPLVLFKKGNLDLNTYGAISIVGTRKPTEEGKRLSREFSRFFAANGLNVVSGLAYGVDIEAHKGALEAGGPTTAVLGHGLDRIYPSTHAKTGKQIANAGCLLSEFHTGVKPDACNFPARNRIISGLSLGTLVIEAQASGGALITAKFAFEQNREVFAIPGHPRQEKSAGCNNLIKNNIAKLVCGPEEVLADLDIKLTQQRKKVSAIENMDTTFTQEERRIVKYLQQVEKAEIEAISEACEMNSSLVNSIVLGMEFKGVISLTPGKKVMLS